MGTSSTGESLIRDLKQDKPVKLERITNYLDAAGKVTAGKVAQPSKVKQRTKRNVRRVKKLLGED
jgi:hypothetical protein